MDKKVAILQSNYVPWKGYFDLINMVDEFIIYDSVQFTKNDWRNRNRIKTPNGVQWFTIPVMQMSLNQKINETKVTQSNWTEKHFKMLCANYSRAPFFKEYKPILQKIYCEIKTDLLSEINFTFIKFINEILGIKTRLTWSTDYRMPDERSERLVDLVKQVNGDVYITGPSAQNYLNQNLFIAAGIKIEWINYNNYPSYNQLYPPFENSVTILDLIFHTGPAAKSFMKSFISKTQSL
jgi:hypothetical protein